MKKILIILLILLIPFIYAEETYFACGGDNEAMIMCYGDNENTFFSVNISTIIPPSGGGGGGGIKIDKRTYSICQDIYYFIINQTNTTGILNYNIYDLENIQKILKDKVIYISTSEINDYINNYGIKCSDFLKQNNFSIIKVEPNPWDYLKYWVLFLSILSTGIIIFGYKKWGPTKLIAIILSMIPAWIVMIQFNDWTIIKYWVIFISIIITGMLILEYSKRNKKKMEVRAVPVNMKGMSHT